jgi:signal transduction histidine kinase
MLRIIVIWFLLSFCFSFSQEHLSLHDDETIIDSLKNVYNNSSNDSLKCITSFKLAHIYGRDQKIELRKKYLVIANSLVSNNTTLRDLAYYYNSLDYLLRNDFEGYHKAMVAANARLKKYNDIAICKDRLSILHNLNISYSRRGEEDKAIKILLEESIPLAKKVKDYEILALSYKSLAILFLNKEDNEKCEYYIFQGIKEIEAHDSNSINYKEILLESYLIYAEILVDFKRYAKTQKYLEKASLLLKNHPDSNLNCNYFYVKAYLNYKTKKYEMALNAIETGLKYAKLTKDFYSFDRIRLLQFMVLKETGNYSRAKEIILSVLNSDFLTVYDKIKYTKELAEVYHKLNDNTNSILYYEKYIAQSDSLHAAEMESKVLDLESKFNTAQKEKQILKLENEKNEASLKAKNNRLFYLLFALISIILLTIVFFLWKYLKNQKSIAKQKEKNYNQNIKVLQKEKELVVMQTIIDSEEAERKRIARDLHDGIGSRLSSLKMQLNQIAGSKINEEDLHRLSSELSLSIADLRQTAYNLIPETLLKLGLEMALKDLCASMANDKVSVYFSAYEISKSISETNQITIYRIVQELLANALKHSNCDEIFLDCSQNGNLFLISLEDNGIGFNTNDIDNFTGLGLKNIQNRVTMLKGKFEIKSSNAGTNFYIELTIQTIDE